jgi:hypothetical protein
MRAVSSVFVVIAACLAAFLHTVGSISPKADPDAAVMGWQTLCAVPAPEMTIGQTGDPIIKPVGRVSEDAKTVYLTSDGENLQAWDHANDRHFTLEDGGFAATDEVVCPSFQAYGWEFQHERGKVEACRAGECVPITVTPKTTALVYAAAKGSVFVGTNWGEPLLFRDGEWCRMTRIGRRYVCREPQPESPSEPSIQFYASVRFDNKTLIGEYPTGQLFQFNGRSVFPSRLTPPPYTGPIPTGGAEAQALAVYCGDLYVGYWPFGEIWRYDGEDWHGPVRLFFGPPKEGGIPYEKEALTDTTMHNIYGQRVTTLVEHEGALYAATSNKNGWHFDFQSSLSSSAKAEYGMIYKITKPGCEVTN